LSPIEFIQKVIYDMNVKFFLDGKFVEGMKIRTHVLSAFLIEDYEYRGRIGASTGMDNTYCYQFLDNFLSFIFLSKGMTIRTLGAILPRIKGME
jgi:hypothetical protein